MTEVWQQELTPLPVETRLVLRKEPCADQTKRAIWMDVPSILQCSQFFDPRNPEKDVAWSPYFPGWPSLFSPILRRTSWCNATILKDMPLAGRPRAQASKSGAARARRRTQVNQPFSNLSKSRCGNQVRAAATSRPPANKPCSAPCFRLRRTGPIRYVK